MSGVFTYQNPPLIRWGPGSTAEVGAELERLGITRAGLVTTRSVLEDPAVLGPVEAALGSRGPVLTSVIGQHAPAADIDAAVEAAASAGVDGLVSLGGGSPIDAAKIVMFRLGDKLGPGCSLPHVAIPTTLSVAELAAGAGMTDPDGAKVGVRDARGLPDAVIYDAELALRTPLDLWLSTGIRALDHALEGFLAEGEHPFSDVMCLEAVRLLFKSLPEAKARPQDVGVRTENQLAAWFSYTLPVPTALGLCHTMGKAIGARHGIPHGVTSCLLMPHVLRYRIGRQADRLAQVAMAMGGPPEAAQAPERAAALIRDLGMPSRIGDFGLGDADLEVAAAAVAKSLRYPADDLLAIYRAAL